MRRAFAALAFVLTASFFITVAIGQPAAQARLVTNVCDPHRPRQDVYVCAKVWSVRQPDGTGRIITGFRVESRGDNSELEDCPATTLFIHLWRPGKGLLAWSKFGAKLCQDGDYARSFPSVKGVRISSRAEFNILYFQKLNLDDDERGKFDADVR